MRFVRTAENLFLIPQGFTRVEYLQSTGTQYIDTNVYPTQLTKAKIEMQFTDVNYKQAVLGSNNGAPNDSGWNNLFGTNENSSTSKPTYFWCQWGQTFDGPVTKDANRHTHTFERNGDSSWTYTVDNTSKTITSGISTQTSPKEMYLFACNNNGTVYRQAKAKVYYCKIWDNGVLARDFIPCIDPLGVACMYDLVGKKPYYNQGTGTFTVGRQVIPVEYLESSGTQYIDTRYNPNSNTKVEAKFKMNETANTFRWLFSSRNQALAGDGYGFGSVSNGFIDSEYNSRVSSTTDRLTNGTVYTIVKDKNVCRYNDSVLTNPESTFTVNYPLPIFALNNIGTIEVSSYTKANCYYFKIYDNDILVRDFIPCKDENNVGFMFDKVSGTCYLNAGTGSFIVGENKYTSKLRLIKDTDGKVRFIQDVLPREYRPLKYLQSTGTQWIKTGINANSNPKYEINFGISYTNPSSPTNQYTGADYGGTYGVVNGSFQWSSVPVVANKRYEIRFVNENGTRNGYVDGVAYAGSTYQSNGYRVLLFAAGENADGTTKSSPFSCKLYYFRAFLGGVVVGDFYPALRKSDNKPGMYDRITKQFFVNQGTGEFNYEI